MSSPALRLTEAAPAPGLHRRVWRPSGRGGRFSSPKAPAARESVWAPFGRILPVLRRSSEERRSQERRLTESRSHLAGQRLVALAGGEQRRAEVEYTSAKQDMVLSNLGLAVSMARGYLGLGLPLEDLVQDAVIGLLKASELYDAERGFRFSTYAKWWIQECLVLALASRLGACRVPSFVVPKLQRLRSAAASLYQEEGRAPTTEEIAKKAGIPVPLARRALAWGQRPASIQSTGSRAEDGELSNVLAARRPSEESWSDRAGFLKRGVKSALGVLAYRERWILELRFGLSGEKVQSRREVATGLGISAERVRQIEVESLTKLRSLRVCHAILEELH